MHFKINFLILIIMMFFLFAGCTRETNLDKGELKYQIDIDNHVTFSGYLPKSDIKLFLPIDLEATNEIITKNIKDYYDSLDLSINVIEYRNEKTYGHFELMYSNPETLYIKINNTLADYATANYGSFEEMIKWEVFLGYKDKKVLSSTELNETQSFLILTVNGSEHGVYYEVPGIINMVSDEMAYKRVNDGTIYIEPGHFGIIAYSQD